MVTAVRDAWLEEWSDVTVDVRPSMATLGRCEPDVAVYELLTDSV